MSADRSALNELAAALIPGGRRVPPGGPDTVERLAEVLRDPRALDAVARAAVVLRAVGLLLSREGTLTPAAVSRWQTHPALKLPVGVLSALIKAAHFDDPRWFAALGATWNRRASAEPARWLAQIVTPETDAADVIESDVVVVGTGAGGAVVGKELAERGYAVVFLEEGRLRRRDEFSGRAIEAHRKFYRHGAFAVGNTVMPILMGRLVGGSTAINTATCFRTPDFVLHEWCESLRTDAFTPAHMQPHFERVERELQTGFTERRYIGPIADIVTRGCDALGWRHGPILRNAPGCDGQGVCDFGCPTDARRSMNLSYIPAALVRGALCYTGTRAQRVWIEDGRAVGVVARRGHRELRVRARATILAGGTIPTPLLLLRQNLANTSGELGRNLSLHPSTAAHALMRERVEGYRYVPQGWHSDQFLRDGILLVGASPSPDTAPLMLPFVGNALTETLDRIDQLASFGVVVRDVARTGRVRLGPRGLPLITWHMTATDRRRLLRGIVAIGEIFFAAGAESFIPMLMGRPQVLDRRGLHRLRGASLRPRDFLCVSWHPLGTCRMGSDPKNSVVDLDHQAHDVPGLFIVDGSVIPGPPGVNTQLTIMAFADRAAERIAAILG